MEEERLEPRDDVYFLHFLTTAVNWDFVPNSDGKTWASTNSAGWPVVRNALAAARLKPWFLERGRFGNNTYVCGNLRVQEGDAPRGILPGDADQTEADPTLSRMAWMVWRTDDVLQLATDQTRVFTGGPPAGAFRVPYYNTFMFSKRDPRGDGGGGGGGGAARFNQRSVPVEMWTRVFGFLSYTELFQALQCCKRWRDVLVPVIERYEQMTGISVDPKWQPDSADEDASHPFDEVARVRPAGLRSFYEAQVEALMRLVKLHSRFVVTEQELRARLRTLKEAGAGLQADLDQLAVEGGVLNPFEHGMRMGRNSIDQALAHAELQRHLDEKPAPVVVLDDNEDEDEWRDPSHLDLGPEYAMLPSETLDDAEERLWQLLTESNDSMLDAQRPSPVTRTVAQHAALARHRDNRVDHWRDSATSVTVALDTMLVLMRRFGWNPATVGTAMRNYIDWRRDHAVAAASGGLDAAHDEFVALTGLMSESEDGGSIRVNVKAGFFDPTWPQLAHGQWNWKRCVNPNRVMPVTVRCSRDPTDPEGRTFRVVSKRQLCRGLFGTRSTLAFFGPALRVLHGRRDEGSQMEALGLLCVETGDGATVPLDSASPGLIRLSDEHPTLTLRLGTKLAGHSAVVRGEWLEGGSRAFSDVRVDKFGVAVPADEHSARIGMVRGYNYALRLNGGSLGDQLAAYLLAEAGILRDLSKPAKWSDDPPWWGGGGGGGDPLERWEHVLTCKEQAGGGGATEHVFEAAINVQALPFVRCFKLNEAGIEVDLAWRCKQKIREGANSSSVFSWACRLNIELFALAFSDEFKADSTSPLCVAVRTAALTKLRAMADRAMAPRTADEHVTLRCLPQTAVDAMLTAHSAELGEQLGAVAERLWKEVFNRVDTVIVDFKNADDFDVYEDALNNVGAIGGATVRRVWLVATGSDDAFDKTWRDRLDDPELGGTALLSLLEGSALQRLLKLETVTQVHVEGPPAWARVMCDALEYEELKDKIVDL